MLVPSDLQKLADGTITDPNEGRLMLSYNNTKFLNLLVLLIVGALTSLMIHSVASAETTVWEQENWSQTVYYRSDFKLDAAESGVIRMTAVGSYELYFNGVLIGSDSVWTTIDEYPISAVKGTNKLGVKVVNRGDGSGNGLIVDVKLEKSRIVSTTSKVENPWYWTDEPQFDTAWTKKTKLNKDPAWKFVQSGNIDKGKLIGSLSTSAEAICGFPGSVDVGSSEGGAIILARIDGINLALGKFSTVKEVTDGDRNTAWNIGTTMALNYNTTIDLLEKMRIDKVRVITKGKNAEDFEKNSPRGYSIQVSNDSFRWTEVAILHGIGKTPGTSYKETEVSFEPVVVRYVRFIIAEIDGITSPVIGEIEVYGSGYVESGTYVSEPLDFGDPSPKNFGLITWESEVPELTELSLQFRTGSPAVGGGIDWSPWSEEYRESGIYISSPEPRQYLQYKVNLSTLSDDVTPSLKSLSIEYSNDDIPVSSAKARVSPNKVAMGERVSFNYDLTLEFSAGDVGIERMVISQPSTATLKSVSGLEGVEHSVKYDNRSLEIDFADPLDASDGVSNISLQFEAVLYSWSHEFTCSLFAPGSINPLNAGEDVGVDPDTGEPYSWSVYASSFLKESLLDVRATPRVFSPDGDGICDYTVIEFTVSKLDVPRDVEIKIFDLSGNLVRDLAKEPVVAGQYTGMFSPSDAVGYWDGRDDDGDLLPPGIYIYRVELKLSGGSEISTGTITISY